MVTLIITAILIVVTAVLFVAVIGALFRESVPLFRRLKERMRGRKLLHGAALWLTGGLLVAIFVFLGFAWGWLRDFDKPPYFLCQPVRGDVRGK